MGKRRIATREQDVLILTETNDVELCRLETDVLYVASPDTIEAWELDSNQQAKNEKTGHYLQVISERSKIPLKVFRNKSTLQGQSTENIASQKQDAELTFLGNKSQKNSALVWVGIICALLAVTILTVVLFSLKNNTSVTMLPVLTAGVGTLIGAKRNNGLKTPQDLTGLSKAETGLITCIVIVENTETYSFQKIDKTLIPEESKERRYKGEPCHVLGLDKNGLWAIEPANKIELNQSPQDCYMALQYEREVNEVYGLNDSLGEKIKLGIFYALCFFLGIILFLIGTVAMGGG